MTENWIVMMTIEVYDFTKNYQTVHLKQQIRVQSSILKYRNLGISYLKSKFI